MALKISPANTPYQNPTYEDMLLLSSLLGPAKPPVASREDVASTFGVHRIQKSGASFVAASVDSAATIPITPGERCLVCLCEYEANEQVRQLAKCAHIFHRDCIDEVGLSVQTLTVKLMLMVGIPSG